MMMMKELEEMKAAIEADTGDFSQADIAYLEQVKTTADLGNYDKSNELLQYLAYDAGLALGLSEEEADKAAGTDFAPKPEEAPAPVDTEVLEAEYRKLVRDYNLSQNIVYEAETRVTDQVIENGFASRETHDAVAQVKEEAEEALRLLNNFKANNSDFVFDSNAKRAELKAQEAKENEAAVWRQ